MFQKECFKLQVQSTNTSEICKCWDTQAAAVEVTIKYAEIWKMILIPKSVFDSARLVSKIYCILK